MKYTYKKNGKSIDVWYSSHGGLNCPFGTVSEVTGDMYIPVRLNEKTKEPEFTWTDGETYQLNDYECLTPEELVAAIKNKDRIFSDDLCKTIMKYGIDKFNFIIPSSPMTRYNFNGMIIGMSNDDPDTEVPVKYRVYEDFNRELVNNYKLKLMPISEEDKAMYRVRDYYTGDLMGLLLEVDGFGLELAE